MNEAAASLLALEGDKALWVPPWLEGPPAPVDGGTGGPPPDTNIHINTVPGEIEATDAEGLQAEIRFYGMIREEPEIARARALAVPEGRDAGYSDTYWTHFNWRADVARLVPRLQKKFPWQSYINTYYKHPPVFGRKYEFVSYDVWGGGVIEGRYTGYRGKPLPQALGTRMFNAIWNDPYPPNIYWIIYRGRMWTRGYGWGPAPWGPPDSDPQHNAHIHVTYLL